TATRFDGFAAAGLSLASTPASSYTVSLDVNTFYSGYADGRGNPVLGVGLGFYSSAPTDPGIIKENFNGLVLRANGDLNLVLAGSVAQTFVTTYAQNTNEFRKLTYTVDTVTGDISDLKFGNVDFLVVNTGASEAAFQAANLQYVGFGSNTQGASYYNSVFVRDFLLTAPIPEPASLSLLSLGMVSALSRRRLRKH
ncbi:MAG TPA: PEP-CTERM sorting domain-containing protein, partial [Roseimicrobium sp.]|nr:PEP-CTERM sorting domain-containing protein [Roseimicrobium sp.]